MRERRNRYKTVPARMIFLKQIHMAQLIAERNGILLLNYAESLSLAIL